MGKKKRYARSSWYLARELTRPESPEARFFPEFQYPSISVPFPLASRFIPFWYPPSFFRLVSPPPFFLHQIYYHPAGNITAVFIAARREETAILLSPSSIKRLFESRLFDSFPTRSPPKRGEPREDLLFRTDSGIGNQLYHCYNGASTAATNTGGGYVRPNRMQRRDT